MTSPRPHRLVIPLDELDPSPHSHEFIGAEHGDELRLVAIHGASRFATEWLAGDDPTWASKPREP